MVNNQSVKILNIKIEKYIVDFTGEEYSTLELITKIDNKVFNDRAVRVELVGEDIIQATWLMRFSQPGLLRYKYKIDKM